MLKNNFYVDNLIFTGNNLVNLSALYSESHNRMLQGGFTLRSWNTNSDELKQQMIEDDNFVDHGCDLEKVLGYKYSTSNDVIQLTERCIDGKVKTKRGILSEASKIFGPLGLCLPVTVRSKMLLRDLWSSKLAWDEVIAQQFQNLWSNLSHDLSQLGNFQFTRCAVNNDLPSDLYIFCDAAKKAYGFSAYSVQDNNTHLVFAKAKVSPMKSKSLPTLELLSVYLAVLSLPSLLESYAKVKFNNIIIAVDAQIVLSWLLSNVVKSKNQFAKNRLKDIHNMVSEISEKFSVNVCAL